LFTNPHPQRYSSKLSEIFINNNIPNELIQLNEHKSNNNLINISNSNLSSSNNNNSNTSNTSSNSNNNTSIILNTSNSSKKLESFKGMSIKRIKLIFIISFLINK